MAKSRADLYSQRLKARAAAIRAGQHAAKQRTQRLYQSIESAQAALDYTSAAQLDAAKVCGMPLIWIDAFGFVTSRDSSLVFRSRHPLRSTSASTLPVAPWLAFAQTTWARVVQAQASRWEELQRQHALRQLSHAQQAVDARQAMLDMAKRQADSSRTIQQLLAAKQQELDELHAQAAMVQHDARHAAQPALSASSTTARTHAESGCTAPVASTLPVASVSPRDVQPVAQWTAAASAAAMAQPSATRPPAAPIAAHSAGAPSPSMSSVSSVAETPAAAPAPVSAMPAASANLQSPSSPPSSQARVVFDLASVPAGHDSHARPAPAAEQSIYQPSSPAASGSPSSARSDAEGGILSPLTPTSEQTHQRTAHDHIAPLDDSDEDELGLSTSSAAGFGHALSSAILSAPSKMHAQGAISGPDAAFTGYGTAQAVDAGQYVEFSSFGVGKTNLAPAPAAPAPAPAPAPKKSLPPSAMPFGDDDEVIDDDELRW